MFRLSYVVLVLLSLSFPSLSEASRIGAQSRSFRSRRAASNTTDVDNKKWTLTDDFQGESFLENWNFFDRSDPTNGLVNYQNADDAKQKKLAFIEGNSLILAVDNTTQLSYGAKRDSVRISSKKKYNAGSLFIADFASMPANCGVWPAWWTVGPSWPHGGEIDVLEGVHKVNTNKMTLHTDAGCVVDHTKQMQGKVDRTDCKSGKDNQGCGVLDSDPTSYGDGFNKAGGGVYAHRWTNSEIDIWHFTRKDVPEDIKSGAPDPSQWPVPTGSFVAGPGCDFTQHFKDHVLTIDTTIGGDWASNTDSLRAAHCTPDASKIVEDPKNFDLARWNITYIRVYN